MTTIDETTATLRPTHSGGRGVRVVTVLVAAAGLWLLVGQRLLAWWQGAPLTWQTSTTARGPVPELGDLVPGVSAQFADQIAWQQVAAPADRWLLALAPGVTAALCLLVGCWAVWQLAGRISGGDPFGGRSVRMVQVLAWAVFGYGVLVPGVRMITTLVLGTDALAGHPGNGSVAVQIGLPEYWGIPIAVLLFLLAEVWRHGARLRDDVDGLV